MSTAHSPLVAAISWAFSGDPFERTVSVFAPSTAVCGILLVPSTDLVRSDAGPGLSLVTEGDWTASDADDQYDVMLETVFGTLTGGSSADTWINVADAPRWYVGKTGIGSKTFVGTFRVRPAGGGSDLDTASVTITATVEDFS